MMMGFCVSAISSKLLKIASFIVIDINLKNDLHSLINHLTSPILMSSEYTVIPKLYSLYKGNTVNLNSLRE